MGEQITESGDAYREQAEATIADLRARCSHYEAMLLQAREEATNRGLMENLYGLRQVWCVAYDSPNPSMDGQPHPIRMADQELDIAVRNYEFMQRQQRVAPKRHLRIETRWVSDYTDVTDVVLPPAFETSEEA